MPDQVPSCAAHNQSVDARVTVDHSPDGLTARWTSADTKPGNSSAAVPACNRIAARGKAGAGSDNPSPGRLFPRHDRGSSLTPLQLFFTLIAMNAKRLPRVHWGWGIGSASGDVEAAGVGPWLSATCAVPRKVGRLRHRCDRVARIIAGVGPPRSPRG